MSWFLQLFTRYRAIRVLHAGIATVLMISAGTLTAGTTSINISVTIKPKLIEAISPADQSQHSNSRQHRLCAPNQSGLRLDLNGKPSPHIHASIEETKDRRQTALCGGNKTYLITHQTPAESSENNDIQLVWVSI